MRTMTRPTISKIEWQGANLFTPANIRLLEARANTRQLKKGKGPKVCLFVNIELNDQRERPLRGRRLQ